MCLSFNENTDCLNLSVFNAQLDIKTLMLQHNVVMMSFPYLFTILYWFKLISTRNYFPNSLRENFKFLMAAQNVLVSEECFTYFVVETTKYDSSALFTCFICNAVVNTFGIKVNPKLSLNHPD